jgi:ABC-2 type transport system ATP-binding protein
MVAGAPALAARGACRSDAGEPIVRARGLAKSFRLPTGLVEAVRGVDIDIDEAEIAGFLGPNGAGKTTTQRMLTTLRSRFAGGSGTWRRAARRLRRRASARSSSTMAACTGCRAPRPSGAAAH